MEPGSILIGSAALSSLFGSKKSPERIEALSAYFSSQGFRIQDDMNAAAKVYNEVQRAILNASAPAWAARGEFHVRSRIDRNPLVRSQRSYERRRAHRLPSGKPQERSR